MYAKLYRLGYLNYIILLVLAIIFYKERTVFLDLAYHLFYIIKDGNVTIQGNRYSAIVTQLFPLITSKLHLPLWFVMLSYSAGFIIYYAICYWICGSVLKNYRMALVLLLFNILFVSDTFFWMLSELPQGIAMMAVVLAWLENVKPGELKAKHFIVFAVLAFVLNFFHPLLIIPLFFVLVFFFLSNNVTVDKRIVVYLAIIFFTIYQVKKAVLVNAYDDKASGKINNFIYMYPHYFGIASNRLFLADCFRKFYWIPVSAATISIVYLFKRNWLRFIFFFILFIGYLLMVNVSYPHNSEPAFYMENFYLPLGIILATPLVYDLLPLLKNTRIASALLLLIIVTGGIRIFLKHDFYSKRLNWERAFLDEHIDEKLFIYNKPEYSNVLLMTWGTSFEFWLLSTSEYGRTASIVIPDNPDATIGWTTESNSFILNWGVYHYSDFKPPYFIFRDTVNHYKVIK